jgi:hypothetical protein
MRHGIWGRDAEGTSSNFWELGYLVDHVEIALATEGLKGVELNSQVCLPQRHLQQRDS